MKLRNHTLILIFAMALILVSCERNPGWDGHKSTAPIEEIAEEACKCIYEVMGEFEGFDTDNVLATMDEYLAAGGTSSDEKFADAKAAFVAKAEIMDKMDAAECMKPIEDNIFNKGLEYEEVQQEFAKHCKLHPFYRF